ncbi:dihydroxyacetone kinase transcriptional activator DhaS [Anaerocolumna sp. AGMB13025]|uniref:dihydroxyacetone kinase transcriptional activator DhaS n=1 Tax=Anaerocolumna sp. AGMB13025 TaxID=3039116 RepID=UPI00241E5C3C|nr:dihydroxyacetone kinase transcriptional activator DhaS [Anaerocolumna sp. AGMB13025]WFR58728.1 dihydroxyacetone kinase transcriptional activator DhaS [Anaerocolumna sp. AGMB13025]
MSDSLITKQAIASGLKSLMNQKGFDKITISDITKSCGLNRQTFYYHFQDKFELLNWIFYNEVITVLTDGLSLDNWQDNLFRMLKVMEDNKVFYQNAINQSFQNEFSEYLINIAVELFCDIIDNLAKDNLMKEEDKKFIAEFYSFGVVGLIVAWAKGGMRKSTEVMIRQITTLVEDSKSFAVKRYFLKNLS